MIYGHARVSTDGQSVDAQMKQLRAVKGVKANITRHQREETMRDLAKARRHRQTWRGGSM